MEKLLLDCARVHYARREMTGEVEQPQTWHHGVVPSWWAEFAGFIDVSVRGDYTDEGPTADSDFVVFIARKPA